MTFESLSMQRTLISFLGTNDYSETVYHWPGLGEYGTTHVAAALAGLWKATHIVVLATQAAEEKNGAGLRDCLAAAALPEPVVKRLPDGRTAPELWMQFRAGESEAGLRRIPAA